MFTDEKYRFALEELEKKRKRLWGQRQGGVQDEDTMRG